MDCEAVNATFLKNIGFIITFKCTIACEHCIVEAGPHRKEEIKLEDARDWIKQASTYRGGHIRGLALTGGEPFYNLDNLNEISEYGRNLGMVVSAVTNAFWASDRDKALKTLEMLPAIRMISFSTDVYHQKYIPFENIKNAIWAAQKLGRLYNIAVCTDNLEDQRFKEIMEDLKEIGEGDNIRISITFPVGRAQKNIKLLDYPTCTEPAMAACTMSSSPVVFPDGKVVACIGPIITLPSPHPLFLGNLRHEKLQDILDQAEMNPVIHVIRAWGPHKLFSLLKEHGFVDLLPNKYIEKCICDTCYKLLSEKRIVDALDEILQNEKMRETIAYARVYYLRETKMVEVLNL